MGGRFLERRRLSTGSRAVSASTRPAVARKQARDRLAFLAEASELLASSLDYESTLERVARLAVPELADWCVVDIVDEAGTVERVAVVCADPASEPLAQRLLETYPPRPERSEGTPKVIRTAQAELIPRVTPAWLDAIAPDEEQAEILRRIGLRSNILVPLVARGRTLGVLTLATAESGRIYSEDDLALAQDLARRAAVAVDNARLFQSSEDAFALLDTLLETAPIGLGFLDRDLRYIRVNRCLAELDGAPPEAHIGRTIHDVLPQLAPMLETRLRHVLETGEPLADLEVDAETPAAPGLRRHWLVSYYPVKREGETAGIGVIVSEITAQKRTQERLAAHSAVSGILAESSTAAEAVPRILEIVCASFGWTLGQLWRIDSGGVLRCTQAWAAPSPKTAEFVRASRQTGFKPGVGLPGRVWAAAKPVWIPDVVEDPNFPRARLAARAGLHAAVGFPLLLGGEVIGVVEFFSSEVREPDDEQLTMMSAVGSQIGQSLERMRAQEERGRILASERAARAEAERAAASLVKLEGVTQAALEHLSLEDLLDEMLRRVADLVRADTSAIYLVDEERGVVVLRAARGFGPELEKAIPVPLGKGFAGRVAQSGQAEIVDDISEVELWSPLLGERGIRSLVAIPIVAEGRVIGVAHAGSGQPGRFGKEDARLLRLVADRIALAINQSRLFEAERSARADAEAAQRRLAFLAEASTVLVSSLDSEALLERVAELAVPELADSCVVDVTDEDGVLRRLVVAGANVAAVRNGEKTGRRSPPLPGGPDGPQAVVRSGRSELAPEYMCVPLRGRERTLGAITFLTRESGRRYGDGDLALAEELARRTVQAIENAELYRAAEERGQAARVLAAVGDGVFLLDGGGAVRYWNPAAAAITGLTAEAVLGRPAAEVIPGWAAIAPRVPVAGGAVAPRAVSLPLELGDREVWLSISGVGFTDGTVYALRDLTHERALEQMKTEFVSTVSHELRTPLAAIYGAAMTLLRPDVRFGEDQRESLLQVIAGESERLARIVNDILWASRLDSDNLQLTIQSCDPLELVEGVVQAVRAGLPEGVSVRVDVPYALPEVAGDPDKVRQVLVNLLDNAIKYSPDGGEVRVALAERDGRVCFSVCDDGLGVPAGEQRRIFEKFYRLDPNLTRGVGGTGLGLYICRELVRRMNGRIWVESRDGAGSTFSFQLPVS